MLSSILDLKQNRMRLCVFYRLRLARDWRAVSAPILEAHSRIQYAASLHLHRYVVQYACKSAL